MRHTPVQRSFFSFLVLFSALLVSLVIPPQGTSAAGTVATPFAALLTYPTQGQPVVSLVFHPGAAPQAIALPAGVSAVTQPDAAMLLADALTQYPFDVTDSAVLRFDGNLEPTAIPTITPVRYDGVAAQPLDAAGAALVVPAGDRTATVVLSVACAGACASDWYAPLLARLPAHAPVVVIAAQTAACAGLWQVRAAAQTNQVVTILTTMPDRAVGACSFSAVLPAAVTPPTRVVTADGTITLLRVVFCLVAVLLLSVSSFYGALALTKRMHAAVGFRPEER